VTTRSVADHLVDVLGEEPDLALRADLDRAREIALRHRGRHLADRADLTRFLDQVDERDGRDQASVLAAPAHERLGAHDRIAVERNDRLVMHDEIALLDRVLEI